MSNIYEYIKMAIHNIMANKGRSFLTMLGIIIGIASVIAIVSIGEGTKNQMNSEINDIGGGQIAVYCSDDAIADQVWIEPEDIDAVRELDGVEGVNVSDSYTGETVTGKGDFNLTGCQAGGQCFCEVRKLFRAEGGRRGKKRLRDLRCRCEEAFRNG